MLPTRSSLRHYHDASYPRLDFPRASQADRMPCRAFAPEVLSWQSNGCWRFQRSGEIPPERLQEHLATVADHFREYGCLPHIKVRISHTEPAKHFIHLTKCMEIAGIAELHVSVFHPHANPM
jgi:hypothetical protein